MTETTPQQAYEAMQSPTKIVLAIKDNNLYKVQWMNPNNNTCFISSKQDSGRTEDNENLKFYIVNL